VIQFSGNVDRGQELFKRFPEAVTQMCIQRKNWYFQSSAYQGLANNCKNMDLYIDNAAPSMSTFVSDITPQTIRKAYNEFVALFKKFLETDPLLSVAKTKGLTDDQRHALTEIISDNLAKTNFRQKCLRWSIDDVVRYGTFCTYSFAVSDFNASSLLTVKGEYDDTYVQQQQQGENAVVSMPIHPMNMIIDPRANAQVSADFQGFIGDISVSNISNLQRMGDNPSYIQKNIKEVLEACKKGLPDKHWYNGPYSEKADFSKGHSNITYLWLRLPFDGNEDDPNKYAVEMIGDKIIRIDQNVLDEETIPLAIGRVLPRRYVWYGNSPLVDKICIQNLRYWIINTMVESTARLMDRIVLYRGGSLDVEAINSRHQTGGLVPVGSKANGIELDKLIHAPQLPSVGINEGQVLNEIANREDQDSSAMPNFNPQAAGGPTNKTLGGAQMMASIGEMKMADLVDDMAAGLIDVAKHHLALMKNIAEGDQKGSLIGKNINFSCVISNVFNYIKESNDSMNRLSQAINFRSTQIPQFLTLKLGPLMKDWLRNSLKRESIDDYIDNKTLSAIDEQDAQKAIQAMQPQQPQQPGMPPQGATGQPLAATPTQPPAPQGVPI
jgi:hypothetical protein